MREWPAPREPWRSQIRCPGRCESDPIRDDHHLGFAPLSAISFSCPYVDIVVRCLGGKLAGTRVHHFIHRADAIRLAQLTDVISRWYRTGPAIRASEKSGPFRLAHSTSPFQLFSHVLKLSLHGHQTGNLAVGKTGQSVSTVVFPRYREAPSKGLGQQKTAAGRRC